MNNNALLAAQKLARGEVLGLPTETVYGLAADAQNPSAVGHIYALKNRPTTHPLITHIAAGAEVARAAAVYGRKYAFVAALLAGAEGPASLAGPLARAQFWMLRPTWCRLVDNTVRFGFKEELVLDERG